MSLKLKIIVVMTFWLLIILILSNIFIYYLFIRLIAGSEIALLVEKSRTLLSKDLPRHPEYWTRPGPLDELLIPKEMIRYITPDSQVAHIIYDEKELLIKEAAYSTRETSSTIRTSQGGLYVYVTIPVYEQGRQVAALEIGRSLNDTEFYLQTLLTALISSSSGAVILSLLGGYLYTRVAFKPLNQLIHTMQTIEKSGVFRLIQLPKQSAKDELAIMGDTFNKMILRLKDNFGKQQQFLADASHELRTPLTIIEGYVSLLRRWAGSDSKLRDEALDAIHSETVHLNRLTHNLLSLIHDEEHQRHHPVTFDLKPIILTTAASLQRVSKRSIVTHLPGEEKDPILLVGDPDKLKQLIIILLDNALKYSKLPVSITVVEEQQHWKLEIADQGIGVAEADIPLLFDRFYRTDKARNRKQGGVGLGLAIANNIVRLHEGTISLSSRLGEGTTVTVKLPRSRQ